MSDRINNSKAYTTETGAVTVFNISGGPADARLIENVMAQNQATIFYMTGAEGFMHFEGVYASGAITVSTILSSSNGTQPVNWGAGQKLIACTGKASDVESIDLMVATPSKLADTRNKLNVAWKFRAGGGPIILAGCGDSNLNGGLTRGGLNLAPRPGVRQWVGSDFSNSLDDAQWQVVDPTGPYINSLTGPSPGPALGYCQGQRANQLIQLAFLLNEIYGEDVFIIMNTFGGALMEQFDPAQGLGASTPFNMWGFVSTSINDALAALNAGTNGAPYALAADHVDAFVFEPGAADLIVGPDAYTFPQPAVNDLYVQTTMDFIAEAENAASVNGGGWAKQFHTQYLVPEVPQSQDCWKYFDGQRQLDSLTNGFLHLVRYDDRTPMADPLHPDNEGHLYLGTAHAQALMAGPMPKTRTESRAYLLEWLAGATSEVADAADAVAFKFDTQNEILLGVLLQLLNNGVLQAELSPEGTLTLQGGLVADWINSSYDFFGTDTARVLKPAVHEGAIYALSDVVLAALPTAAPGAPGRVWKDVAAGNVLKVS